MTSTPHHAALRLTFAATALIGTLAATGCATGPKLVTPEPPPIPKPAGNLPSANKAVLKPGTQIVADTAAGPIKIEAGPGLRRVFDWDGLRRGAITKPRMKRFAGESSKGLYFDGKPTVWKPAHGITKLRYEEGYRNFDNIDDAMIWMQIRRLYYTYNNNGLVVGWKRRGDTLQVEVWQFTIDGKKPSSMPGSQGARIAEGPLKAEPQQMSPRLVFADGHTEPYTTATAAEYSNARAGGAAGGSNTTAASSQTSHCSWIKGLFGQCRTAAADTADNTTQHGAAAKTSAPSASAANNAPSTSGPAASADAARSTTDQHASSVSHTSAPRAQIAGSLVNIRSRPTTHSDVLFQARQGDSVAILKKDRGWRYVKLGDGHKGWIADFLLKQ